jgi:hypothetical protein
LREAKRIAQGLEEIAELDSRFSRCEAAKQWDEPVQQWDEASLSRREALVAELAEICRSHPALAAESFALFEAMLERTRLIERQIRAERNQAVCALQEAETNLKQLGAFGDRIPRDAQLLNRLA